MPPDEVEIAIVGAGIAGIATAYALSIEHGVRDLLILDPRAPMSLTTARSGENYRNWWPHPTMVAFTDSSIDLMERIARESANAIRMTRRGYALATRADDVGGLVASLEAGYGTAAAGHIRVLDTARAGVAYVDCATHGAQAWELAPDGIDVITDPGAIRRHFPHYAEDIRCVVHVRRAGDISAQQMGQFMLEAVRGMGGRLKLGRLTSVVERNGKFALEVETEEGSARILAETLVDAAGPFVAEVAAMLGVTLPTETVFQQKIAFRDRAAAIPRRMAFAIDLDPQVLDWTAEERDLVGADSSNAWLTGRFPGGHPLPTRRRRGRGLDQAGMGLQPRTHGAPMGARVRRAVPRGRFARRGGASARAEGLLRAPAEGPVALRRLLRHDAGELAPDRPDGAGGRVRRGRAVRLRDHGGRGRRRALRGLDRRGAASGLRRGAQPRAVRRRRVDGGAAGNREQGHFVKTAPRTGNEA